MNSSPSERVEPTKVGDNAAQPSQGFVAEAYGAGLRAWSRVSASLDQYPMANMAVHAGVAFGVGYALSAIPFGAMGRGARSMFGAGRVGAAVEEGAVIAGRLPPHLQFQAPIRRAAADIPPPATSMQSEVFPLPAGVVKPKGNVDLLSLGQEMIKRHNPAKSYESGAFIRGDNEILRTFQARDAFLPAVRLPAHKSTDIMFHTHPPGCLPGPSSGDLELTRGIGLIGTGASKYTNGREMLTVYQGQFAAARAGEYVPTRALIIDLERKSVTAESSIPFLAKDGKTVTESHGLWTGELKWSEVEPVLRNWDRSWESIQRIPGFRTQPMTQQQFFNGAR